MRAVLATLALAGAVFALDVFVPKEVSIGVLYVGVILVAATAGWKPLLVLVTALCLVLTVAGFFLSPPDTRVIIWDVELNRLLTVGVLILVAALRSRQRETASALAESMQRLQAEVSAAQAVQARLYPRGIPGLPGYELAGVSAPVGNLSGDYLDVLHLPGGRAACVVADVSGHGFGPALIAVETRAVLRQMLHVETDPSTVLTRLNCILCDDTDDEVFVTMFLLVLDPQKGSLEYAAAGHEGFRISPQGMVERLPANGLPLGLEPGAVYRARPQRPLQEGETIVVVTDGLIEARSSAGDLYGTPRLVRALPEWCRSSANEMLERLVSKVQAFAPGAPLDDATLLVLKRCADAVGPADAVREEHSSRFEAEKLALKVGAT